MILFCSLLKKTESIFPPFLQNTSKYPFRYIISAETGNLIIWLRLTQQVISKDEQPGIRQLTLMEGGNRVLSISKPSNPPGTDLVRTVATVCVREIPSKYTSSTLFQHFRTIFTSIQVGKWSILLNIRSEV